MDPKGFIENKMNVDEFEYMGTEMLVWKKGQEAALHHKILVKEKVLRSLIDEYEKQDQFFIPLKGKILSYQKFFAMVCHSGTGFKKAEEESMKEKRKVARTNDFDQIKVLEEKKIELLLKKFDSYKKDIDNKKNNLSTMTVNLNQKDNMYDTLKETLEFERNELDRKLVKEKNKIVKYYEEVLKCREDYELHKAAIVTERNKRKRKRRAADKAKRQREKYGKDEVEATSDVEDKTVEENSLSTGDISSDEDLGDNGI